MEILIGICVLLIAFLYSSIGHGGATGYLAVMALFGISSIYMKPSALTLNLFVAGISFVMYYKSGFFRISKLIPFIITSVPMAYLGGATYIEPSLYKNILGVFLLFASLRLLYFSKEKTETSNDIPFLPALIIGAGLGYVSGIIGIGGGIILSPLLILLKWATIKEAAAVSAMFIFVNSGAGLFGQVTSGCELSPFLIFWISAGIIGALAGGYLGSRKLNFSQLRIILGLVLILASFKLFLF